jgi:hypothetical protein
MLYPFLRTMVAHGSSPLALSRNPLPDFALDTSPGALEHAVNALKGLDF